MLFLWFCKHEEITTKNEETYCQLYFTAIKKKCPICGCNMKKRVFYLEGDLMMGLVCGNLSLAIGLIGIFLGSYCTYVIMKDKMKRKIDEALDDNDVLHGEDAEEFLSSMKVIEGD